MKTTGVFEALTYKIPANKTDVISLLPFGDVHYGAPLHAAEVWEEWLADAREMPNAYFLGMGDYMDLASTSERALLFSKQLHESTEDTLEQLVRAKADEFASQIGFMRGRLIGLLEGNHYGLLRSGMTTTQYLCELLQCKYLGVNAFVRTQFMLGPRVWLTKDLYIHHGKGSGRLPGGSLNPVYYMSEQAEADIYLMGHDHQRGIWPGTPRLYYSRSGFVKERPRIFGRTGSFLKSRVPGERSYIVDRGLGPTSLGGIRIEFRVREKRSDSRGKYIEMRAVT